MLFALFNYFQYKKRRGSYSDKILVADGGRIASAKNFKNLPQFTPQYMFLMHTRYSLSSWLVMYFTGSPWSHCGNFTQDGNIIDVTLNGLIEHPFTDYFDDKSVILILSLKEKLNQEQIDKMIQWGRKNLGRPYGWGKVRKFFWMIVFGKHADYELRISADVLIILCVFFYFWMLCNFPCVEFFPLLAIFYLVIILCNTPRRRAMRKALWADDPQKRKLEVWSGN